MSDIRTDHDFAQLGFGLMRLPQLEEGGNDIEETKKLVDAFMDAGFTYFDTAPTYHGGTSEIAAKEALVDRYPRESFQLATKMPAWAAKSLEEARRFSIARSNARVRVISTTICFISSRTNSPRCSKITTCGTSPRRKRKRA